MKKSLAILCLLFINFSTITTYAQTKFVKVIPLSKYDFKISNVSIFNFQVELNSKIYTISSQRMQPLKTKILNSSSTMQVIYPIHEYNRVENIVIREIAKYTTLDNARLGVNSYLKKREKQKNPDFLQSFGRIVANELSKYFIEQEVDRLKKLLNDNQDLYNASNGSRNQYSSNFQKTYIYSYATSGKIAKRGLTPKVNFSWDFPTKKDDLGDYWGRKSSDFTSEMTLSYRLLPELRWGDKNTFTSIHGFLSLYRPSYGLKTGSRDFYVGSDYIAGGAPDLVELSSGENINLNLNQVSGGLFIRNYFYPNFFFDIGAGYYIANSARFHFDSKGENDNEVHHLPNPLSFDEQKPRNAAVVNQKEIYGMARVGIHITKTGIYQPAQGFFLVGGCRLGYQPTFEIGENHELYYTDVNIPNGLTPQKVPIMEASRISEISKQKPKLTLKFGLGVSF